MRGLFVLGSLAVGGAAIGYVALEATMTASIASQLDDAIETYGLEQTFSYGTVEFSLWRRSLALTDVVVRDAESGRVSPLARAGCEGVWVRRGRVSHARCQLEGLEAPVADLAGVTDLDPMVVGLLPSPVVKIDLLMAWAVPGDGHVTSELGLSLQGLAGVSTEVRLDGVADEVLDLWAARLQEDLSLPETLASMAQTHPELMRPVRLEGVVFTLTDDGVNETIRQVFGLLGADPGEAAVDALIGGFASLGTQAGSVSAANRTRLVSYINEGGALRVAVGEDTPVPLFGEDLQINPALWGLMDDMPTLTWVAPREGES